MARYRKCIAAALGAVLTALVGFWTDGTITASEWVNVGIAGVSAFNVYAAANLAGGGEHIKAWIAALTAGLTFFSSSVTDGISGPEWLQFFVIAGTAAGVWGVRNEPELTGSLEDGAHFADGVSI